jgi:hypothetical protein
MTGGNDLGTAAMVNAGIQYEGTDINTGSQTPEGVTTPSELPSNDMENNRDENS